LDSIPAAATLLDTGWKFHAGDSVGWASSGYDDKNWEKVNPTLQLYYLPQIQKQAVGWFRIHLHVDPGLLNKPLAFEVYQTLATEIDLNGQLIKRYGTISAEKNKTKAYQPNDLQEGILFSKADEVIAVRFSTQTQLPYFEYDVAPFFAFRLVIDHVGNAPFNQKISLINFYMNFFVAGLFLIITLIHFCFFIYYRKQKANIYFAISAFFGSISRILHVITVSTNDVTLKAYAAPLDWIMLFTLHGFFLYLAIWQLFYTKRGMIFWILSAYSVIGIFILIYFYQSGWLIGTAMTYFLCLVESMRVTIKNLNKNKSVRIILTGLACCLLFFFIFIMLVYNVLPDYNLAIGIDIAEPIYQISAIALPVSLSIYLSREFATTSKELERKLTEVELLSARSISQEQEKQQILFSQNETLEQQVKERTSTLNQSLLELKSTQSQLIQSEKMASLGELTAGIAHEIQNPLNFVNNFSELNSELSNELEQEAEKWNIEEIKIISKDIKENSEKINHHGKRADAIVKGMLQHSQKSSGQKEPTDINALADEYLRLAYLGLRGKDNSFNVAMKTDFDNSIEKINIIPQDIRRVLINLYNNAFYTIKEKKIQNGENYQPTIFVGTKKINDKVEIKVKDNGNGIPQKILDKIFQPFFTTKPTGQGTGLGLSLAYDIVKAHGGDLKVETKEGEGSEFIINLNI
jgi:two-component system, NtrC family, sensor kinase